METQRQGRPEEAHRGRGAGREGGKHWWPMSLVATLATACCMLPAAVAATSFACSLKVATHTNARAESTRLPACQVPVNPPSPLPPLFPLSLSPLLPLSFALPAVPMNVKNEWKFALKCAAHCEASDLRQHFLHLSLPLFLSPSYFFALSLRRACWKYTENLSLFSVLPVTLGPCPSSPHSVLSGHYYNFSCLG